MRLLGKSLLRMACAALSCAAIYNASAGEVAVTEDFDFGTWSPFLERWEKRVSVCVWDSSGEDLLFTVQATGIVSNQQFGLQNNVGGVISYSLHWLDGSNGRARTRLSPNLPSNRVFRSDDSSRCESGPTGMLQLTLDAKELAQSTPGIYTDTIVLTISTL